MPLQNRVTPFGDLIATPERGLMFGNRGVLHNHRQQIVRYNQGRRWIVCVLEFRGRHRAVMQPGLYTELFFLDEATALAAGHRPCAECRHPDYQQFRRCWAAMPDGSSSILPSADQIDAQLHQDRLTAPGVKRVYRADIASLADGVFVLHQGEAWLLWQSALLHWTASGYDQRQPRPAYGEVPVLTPHATARTIAAGYVPAVHPSAD
ncbi:MAG: hypothetical protein OJF49_003732 [Ktedonobacterales bacterium]|nr:MAG: hypothetical protein OJF49_003732 [Ktedonobacterales bacterium]